MSAIKEGLHFDLDETTYHEHPTSLSVSGAKVLLKAPALFKWQQDNPVYKSVFDEGSAAHALVLGQDVESLVYVVPFDDWRTQAAQAEKALAREMGLAPILPATWRMVSDMADELSKHPIAGPLMAEGLTEVSAFGVDERTGVMRRARADLLREDLRLLVDYKTTRNSAPWAFAKDAASYGYFQQHAWYLDLFRDLDIDLRSFVFVAQMSEPPYLVSVTELVADAVDRGRDLNDRALEMFRDCTESGIWPGFTQGITPIDIPRWAYFDNQESA